MYKEFRELSRVDAVKSLYQDMAARHRARFRSIHVCHDSVFFPYQPIHIILHARSSVSWKSKKLKIFAAPTSNSCLCPTSSSLCPIGSPRRARHSLLTARPLSECSCGMRWSQYMYFDTHVLMIWLSMREHPSYIRRPISGVLRSMAYVRCFDACRCGLKSTTEF